MAFKNRSKIPPYLYLLVVMFTRQFIPRKAITYEVTQKCDVVFERFIDILKQIITFYAIGSQLNKDSSKYAFYGGHI